MLCVNLKILLLGLLLLPAATALAQSQIPPGAAPRTGETRTLVIKTSPIDLLLPHNTTLWLGGEKQVAPQISWQTDLGYVFRQDAIFDLSDAFPDLKFRSTDRQRLNYNLKTELRRYMGRNKGLNGFYGAGQLMYKVVNFNSNEAPGYDWHEYSSLFYDAGSYWAPSRRGPESNYHLREREVGGSMKLGYQHIFSRFTLDLFTGLNVRNQRATQDLGEPSPPNHAARTGGVWLVLPVVGGKFGLAF